MLSHINEHVCKSNLHSKALCLEKWRFSMYRILQEGMKKNSHAYNTHARKRRCCVVFWCWKRECEIKSKNIFHRRMHYLRHIHVFDIIIIHSAAGEIIYPKARGFYVNRKCRIFLMLTLKVDDLKFTMKVGFANKNKIRKVFMHFVFLELNCYFSLNFSLYCQSLLF